MTLLVVEKQMSTLEKKHTHLGYWADSSKQEIFFFNF